MEFKHTPAPWINVGGWVDAEDNGIICSISAVSMKPEDVDEANANLIAAAPELLSTLQLIISYHDDGNEGLHREDLEMARKAIAKALGQQ